MYRDRFIRGKIKSFYEDKPTMNHNSYLTFCNVHLIDIKETDEKVLIKIFAERPGIMIGSRGSLLNELKEMLIYHLLKLVEIEIKEFNPFTDGFKIERDNVPSEGDNIKNNPKHLLEKGQKIRLLSIHPNSTSNVGDVVTVKDSYYNHHYTRYPVVCFINKNNYTSRISKDSGYWNYEVLS